MLVGFTFFNTDWYGIYRKCWLDQIMNEMANLEGRMRSPAFAIVSVFGRHQQPPRTWARLPRVYCVFYLDDPFWTPHLD